MILYRCITSDEIISMINDKNSNKKLVSENNTLNYDKNESYKQFFLFAEHAQYYKKIIFNTYFCIGQYIIPNDKITKKGFAYYSGIETMRNNKLCNMCIPLPVAFVKNSDFENSFLYKLESNLYSDFLTNSLDNDDNKKYNEPIIDCLRFNPNIRSYLDYTYADVYYEMLYQLGKKFDMNFEKVLRMLNNVNLYDEIKKFFEDNANLFHEQTKQYVKSHKKNKKIFISK